VNAPEDHLGSAGLPPIADIARCGQHGRKVPKPAVSNRSKTNPYSITSSALATKRRWRGSTRSRHSQIDDTRRAKALCITKIPSIEAHIAQRIRLYSNAAGGEGPIVNHEKHETTSHRG
jgi:hypothetical protein